MGVTRVKVLGARHLCQAFRRQKQVGLRARAQPPTHPTAPEAHGTLRSHSTGFLQGCALTLDILNFLCPCSCWVQGEQVPSSMQVELLSCQ